VPTQEKNYNPVPHPHINTSHSPSAAFKAMTREKYLTTHVRKKSEAPPIGYYWPGHKAIDPELRTPKIAHPGWDGQYLNDAIKIKEKEFAKSAAHVCPRVPRALVKYRDHQVQLFKMVIEESKGAF